MGKNINMVPSWEAGTEQISETGALADASPSQEAVARVFYF